jgi:hypothetical protein
MSKNLNESQGQAPAQAVRVASKARISVYSLAASRKERQFRTEQNTNTANVAG